MSTHRSFLQRWLSLAALIALLGFLGAAVARALPVAGRSSTATSLATAEAPPTDPNFKDPDWGAPPTKMPKPVTGWAPNQDTRKPKDFPHYGRMEFKLCDLPFDKDKGGQFNKWTEGNQRSWCRSQLNKQFGMTADYTNHELVEEVPDGSGGTMKVLAVYKVWKDDHAKTGRGKLYHPRKAGEENYYGGISQMANLPDSAFKKKAPPKEKKDKKSKSRTSLSLEAMIAGDVDESCGELCEQCGPCADSDDDAAAWCGDGTGELYCPEPATTTVEVTP